MRSGRSWCVPIKVRRPHWVRVMVKRAADGTTVVTVIESTVAVKGEGADSVKVAAGQRSILDHGHAQAAQAIANTDPDA